MNPELNNPFDDKVRDILEEYTMDPPMHLWESIEKKRSGWYKFSLAVKKRWPLLVLMGMIGAVWAQSILLQSEHEPFNLGSFAIPGRGSEVAKMASESDKVKTAPFNDAGLEQQEVTDEFTRQNKGATAATKIGEFKNSLPVNFTPLRENSRKQSGKLTLFYIEPLKKYQPFNHIKPIALLETKAFQKTHSLFIHPKAQTDDIPFMPIQRTSLTYELDKEVIGLPVPLKANHSSMNLDIELLGSVYKTIRTLETFSDEFDEYLQLRDETEKLQPAISSGVNFVLTIPNQLRIKSGFHVLKMNERFNYFNPTAEQTEIMEVKDPNTGAVLRADTTRFVGPLTEVANNRLTTFDIPLLIGYEKQIGRFGIGLTGGAFINVFFRNKGTILDPVNFQPIDFSSDNPENSLDLFKDKVGVSWYGSLNMAYRINPSLGLVLEPNLRYFPSYFNDPDFVVNQKYLNLGVSLGLRYRVF